MNKNKDGSLCLWDKDAFSVLYGQIIRKIEIDSSQSEWAREYCAYALVIHTDKGKIVFDGTHDAGGMDLDYYPLESPQ